MPRLFSTVKPIIYVWTTRELVHSMLTARIFMHAGSSMWRFLQHTFCQAQPHWELPVRVDLNLADFIVTVIGLLIRTCGLRKDRPAIRLQLRYQRQLMSPADVIVSGHRVDLESWRESRLYLHEGFCSRKYMVTEACLPGLIFAPVAMSGRPPVVRPEDERYPLD